MYNLIIVDDEPIIVDSYYELLSEAFENRLNIEKAYLPSEAIKKANNRVDILVTDIIMPRMDGYELRNEISRLWPRCHVIFLTGNNDIRYAQTAIRNGPFVDYILKTENSDTLIDAVNKAINSIENLIRSDEVLQNIQKNIKLALPLLRKELFMDIINGKNYNKRNMAFKFRQYDIELSIDKPVLLPSRLSGQGT